MAARGSCCVEVKGAWGGAPWWREQSIGCTAQFAKKNPAKKSHALLKLATTETTVHVLYPSYSEICYDCNVTCVLETRWPTS